MTKKEPSMDTAYKHLQQIVKDFESGEVKLEDSVDKFKQGLKLAKFLKGKLNQIENQVEELTQEFNQDQTK